MTAVYTLAAALTTGGGLLKLAVPGLAMGVSAGLLYAIVRLLQFLLIYLGIALPAVWSKDAQRRKDALTTLKTLLPLLRRGPRGP